MMYPYGCSRSAFHHPHAKCAECGWPAVLPQASFDGLADQLEKWATIRDGEDCDEAKRGRTALLRNAAASLRSLARESVLSPKSDFVPGISQGYFVLGCEHGHTKRHWVLESGKVPAHWCPGPLGPAPDGEVPQTDYGALADELDDLGSHVRRSVKILSRDFDAQMKFADRLHAAAAALRTMKGADRG